MKNGKIYVGITNNFNNRMIRHNYDAYKLNSHLPIHKAMRKYKHKTEIWAKNIDDRYLLEMLEIQTIKQLKENGIELYNCTEGGEGIVGISHLKGEESHLATKREYYEYTSVERNCFIKICHNKNWNFNDFIEIEDYRSIFYRHKRFFYLYKYNRNIKDNIANIKEYIENLSITYNILKEDKSIELHDLIMDIYLEACTVDNIKGISNSVLQKHYSRIKLKYFFENDDEILKIFQKNLPKYTQKLSIYSEGRNKQEVVLLLSVVNSLIKKFKINVNQIIMNSDNTLEDIVNEAFIVVSENKEDIDNNKNVFINELRKRCLRFNKYGKRIESSERWKVFNDREERLQYDFGNNQDLDEDFICDIETIKTLISKEDYEYLIYYYSYGYKLTAKKYSLKEETARKRATNLIKKIRKLYKGGKNVR